MDSGTCHTPCYDMPCAVLQCRQTEPRQSLFENSEARVCRHQLGDRWALSSTRQCRCRMGHSPFSFAYSMCRSESAWASPGAPYTSLFPCSAPACLHACMLDSTVPLEACASEALARCSCPLPLRSWSSYQTSPARTSRAPCPQGVNSILCLFVFLYSSPCVPLVLCRSHPVHVLPSDDTTRIYLRLTYNSPTPVLLYTGTSAICTRIHRRGRYL